MEGVVEVEVAVRHLTTDGRNWYVALITFQRDGVKYGTEQWN